MWNCTIKNTFEFYCGLLASQSSGKDWGTDKPQWDIKTVAKNNQWTFEFVPN